MGQQWAQASANFIADSAPWFHERIHWCEGLLSALELGTYPRKLVWRIWGCGCWTNLSSRLKMNQRDCWVCVCILSDFWVCVCFFCVWLTRKISCWVCVLCLLLLCLVDKEDLLFLFLCLCLCFWVCDFWILILFS